MCATQEIKPAQKSCSFMCMMCLSLPMSQLAFLDADMRWKVEHGKVELMVGASSEDIRGKAEFMIVGDAYPDGKNRSFVADTKIM